MFTKILALFALLTGTAQAAYFPTFTINNFNQMGVYNLTPPVLADGSTGQLQLNANGKLLTFDNHYDTNWTSLLADTASINAKIPANLTVTATRLVVDGSGVVQPVSMASSPLPTGGATSALQVSGNASLTSIDTKIPALGQALAAASVPVVLTAAQLATLTPLTSVTVTQATGTNLHTVVDSSALPTGASTSALQTSGNASLTSIDGKTPALGQTTMAASSPVTIASNQSALPVSQSGTWTVTSNPSSISGFSSTGGSSSSQQSFAAPGSAKYLLVQGDPANTDSIRFGSVSTSSTVGMVLAPGQDSGLMPFSSGATVFVSPVTGTQKVNITWLF